MKFIFLFLFSSFADASSLQKSYCFVRLEAARISINDEYFKSLAGKNYHTGIFRGLMRASALRPGQYYHGTFSYGAIQFESYNPETRVITFKDGKVVVSRELKENENFFVPSNVDLGKWKILGDVSISTYVAKPENISLVLALSALRNISLNKRFIPKGSPLLKQLENFPYLDGDTINKLSVEELTAKLDAFYKATGINPYKLGVYHSLSYVSKDALGAQLATAESAFYPPFAKHFLEMSDSTKLGDAAIDRMTEIAWLEGEKRFPRVSRPGYDEDSNRFYLHDYQDGNPAQTFKNKEIEFYKDYFNSSPNKERVDALLASIRDKHPGSEVVIVPAPGSTAQSTSTLMGKALKALGYNVMDAVKAKSEIADASQKSLNLSGRMNRFRHDSNFSYTIQKDKVDNKIVVVIDDVETTGITMDNIMNALQFRSSAQAVYGLSVFRKF